MGIIDLLDKKYRRLQARREYIWQEEEGEEGMDISPSEWYLISRIYDEGKKISEIGKGSNSSRQAIHKNLQGMKKKGLIKIENVPENRKEKMAILTPLGRLYYEKDQLIKKRLEEEIGEVMGLEKIHYLEEILRSTWE